MGARKKKGKATAKKAPVRKKAAKAKKKAVRKTAKKKTTRKSTATQKKASGGRTRSSSTEKGEGRMEGMENQERMTPDPEYEADWPTDSGDCMEPSSGRLHETDSPGMGGDDEMASGDAMGGDDAMGSGDAEMYDQPSESMDSGPDVGDLQPILIEIRTPAGADVSQAFGIAQGMSVGGFQLDASYEPVPVEPTSGARLSAQEESCIVRGFVERAKKDELKRQLEAEPAVLSVYDDTKIAGFGDVMTPSVEDPEIVQISSGTAPSDCPIPPCDCDPRTPKGTISDVARYLGCDRIWAQGKRGTGIVIGIVDGGITAQGRVTGGRIPNVIGGYPGDWGKIARWGGHGNMTATDALGMAPDARIYDIRISDGDAISAALAGFNWAIQQHRLHGKPQILSNSWGIFQEAWDRVYARDPNHPFTRKVVEAVNRGIIVLFAAGNCGKTCPDGRCGSDTGPGRSIWGANGHPLSITVGAVNIREQFIGYSSQGPAALDPRKPDFCAPSHFRGYFNSDSGTSAACPVAAGVVALMKQSNPALTAAQAKQQLMSTAKNIGPAGWDQHSGAGIINALRAIPDWPRWHNWHSHGGRIIHGIGSCSWAANRLDTFAIGTNSRMYHKWWDGSQWRGWQDLGGTCISAPAAVSWGPNRIDTFVIGTNSRLYHKWWDGSQWRGWENLGGTLIHGVDVSSWSANRLDVFAIGTNSRLYHKWWDGSQWRGWENLGGTCISAPAAVSWGRNRIDVFVIGTNSRLYHKWWDGSQWRGWENLGGTCIQGVTAASWSANRLDVFVAGTNSRMYHKWWDGSRWRGWEDLGGTIIAAPSAVSWGPNRIDTFVVGTNSAMYHKYYGTTAAAAAQPQIAAVTGGTYPEEQLVETTT